MSEHLFGEPLQLTTTREIFLNKLNPCINYSSNKITTTEFHIEPYTLLFENDIRSRPIDLFMAGDRKAFFRANGDFPFDIFAASFYLLSRYEEYLPHVKDMYGRYAHENSLAFKENFLHLPLINYWLLDFRRALQSKFPGYNFPEPAKQISFWPTYDIDQAFSMRHKPLFKKAGGLLKSFFQSGIGQTKERWNVLTGKSEDPFDAYEWMDNLHREHDLRPVYFFIVAARNGQYDKNILPSNRVMQDLILQHAEHYSIGVHPSWQSGDDVTLIKSEMRQLSEIAQAPIVNSRQHYIRFTLPHTFRLLVDAGIKYDFSMGYGSINGFRASVASPFYWFDLERNETTTLRLNPFCYMDANSFFEQKYSAQQAFEEMKEYYSIVKSVNGTMISIWHNNFLGTDPFYAGWKEVYEKFVVQIISQTISGSGGVDGGVL
ncbi:MAG: polysaccharide deacetylase family protein [Chitinophagaceae bacterium]